MALGIVALIAGAAWASVSLPKGERISGAVLYGIAGGTVGVLISMVA